MNEPTTPAFGVLMVHLGTPDAPTPAAVRRYLAEFLRDPRVIQLPRWLWYPFLYGVILRIRPPRLAKLYASVWQEGGSPLRVIAEQQRAELQSLLAGEGVDAYVQMAMSYGEPSVAHGLAALKREGVTRVLVLPMYPQYSATTTAAVFDAVARALKPEPDVPELRFIRDWRLEPDYIAALAESVGRHRAEHPFERLLISFHGIPQRYADAGDPYAMECRETALALSRALELGDDEWAISFQSRFGREPWLQPYTDQTLKQWAGEGVKRVAVLCPGFSADCLETLEEIAVQNREFFLHAGGEDFRYIPALNAEPAHMDMFRELIVRHTQGWAS